jgi:hypothetical protein
MLCGAYVRKTCFAAPTFGFIALLLQGCVFFGFFPTFKAYPGPERADQELAILENRWGCPFCVDRILGELDRAQIDRPLVYSRPRDGEVASFKLVPGTYLIEYSFATPQISRVSRWDIVVMKAGHTYRVEQQSCFYSCPGGGGPRRILWIEDRITGEVVAGYKWRRE